MSVTIKYPISLAAAVLLCSLGAAGAAQNDPADGAGRSNKVIAPRPAKGCHREKFRSASRPASHRKKSNASSMSLSSHETNRPQTCR